MGGKKKPKKTQQLPQALTFIKRLTGAAVSAERLFGAR